jgi:hypothetical protein
MHVNDDYRHVIALLPHDLIDTTKWIVDVVGHENAPLQVDDQSRQAIPPPHAPTLSGRPRRKVGRTDKMIVIVQVGIDLLLFPDMISRCQNLHSRRQELLGAFDVNTHTARCVFRISDDEIDRLVFDQ